MLLLWLFILETPLGTEPIEARFNSAYLCWFRHELSADDAHLVVSDESRIWVYRTDGEPRFDFRPDFLAEGQVVFDDHLIVTGSSPTDGQPITAVFLEGEMIGARYDSYRNLTRLGKRLFGFVYDEDFVAGHHPPVCVELDPLTLETIDTFWKSPPSLAQRLDAKRAWVTEHGDVLLFMGQTSDRVFFVNHRVAGTENALGVSTRGVAPYLTLESPRQPLGPFPFALDTFTTWDRGKVLVMQQNLRESHNLFFGRVTGGYAHCFEVPDRIDSFYVGKHLGIQLFDESFRPRGPVLHRFGQIMGVSRGRLAVFYPNGEILDPRDPEHLRAHYGLRHIEGFETLERHTARIREREPGLYCPVVEFIETEP